jgi:hypothetical protein
MFDSVKMRRRLYMDEVEVGVRIGRKQGLFLPLDVAYFLKTTTHHALR